MEYGDLENIIDNYLEPEHYQGEVFGDFAFPRKQVLKAIKIAYLEGLLKYNIWADSIPNGDSICDAMQDELVELKSGIIFK